MLEKKIRRYKIMDAHREFVRAGKYQQARAILQLLRKGKVSLGLGDESWEVESFLETVGCRFSYGRGGYTATAYL